ncbi:type III pantothenate kinase [Dehalococcoidia bacterium]|nr:type III pantothenate kinase [Dehalococcoidia bacterium]
MLLAVDIGNTNITVGIFRGEDLQATWRMATDVRRQGDEYAAIFMQLLNYNKLSQDDIDSGIISSVVPPLIGTFEELLRKYFRIDPIVVGSSGTKTGIRILYENPREVGADRIAHAIAAYRLYGGPLIIVDFGTATVFDAVNADGDYLGGAIAPGINLAAEALFERASKLPRIEIERPKQVIGRNTVSSMQAGLYYGYVGLVEGLVGLFKGELGGETKVVATGGLARAMAGDIHVIDVVNYDLVLIGLRILYEINNEQSTTIER